MIHRVAAVASFLCGLLAGSLHAAPQVCTSVQAELVPADPPFGQAFGSAVALSGDTLLIGARADSEAGHQAGAAYVFREVGGSWVQEAKLIGTGVNGLDYFGATVALDGDTAMVTGVNLQSVWVFERSGTTWTEQQVLAPGGGGDGASISIDGDTAVFGAQQFGGHGVANVYVHDGASWVHQQTLLASDGAPGDWFGGAVSLDGDTVLIGATGEDDPGGSSGAVYVFVREGTVWSEQAKLEASDANGGDLFGQTLALEGDVALIGSPGDQHAGFVDAGSAFVFTRAGATWTQRDKLVSQEPSAGLDLGTSVALSGNTALLGAAGPIHRFEPTGVDWQLVESLEGVGYFVALEGSTAMSGSPYELTDSGVGVVYVLTLGGGNGPARDTFCFGDGEGTACPCGNVGGDCEGCANSSNSGAQLLASGSASVVAADLVLSGAGLVPNQAGLYFQGLDSLGAGVPFGDGLRCVGGAIVRIQVRFADGSGSSSTTLDIAAQGGVAPGDLRRYQLWYRDAFGSPCGSTFNLTPGVELLWAP